MKINLLFHHKTKKTELNMISLQYINNSVVRVK